MAKFQLRNTRIYVWFFSIMVLIVPLLIGAGLVLRLGSDDFQDSIISAVSSERSTAVPEGADRQPVKLLLQQKIQVPLLSILIAVLLGSTLSLLFFYRYLIRPMDQMALTARQIIEGNLDISMPKYSCCEVNELGRSFNDLSTNLQEVILLVWNYLRDSSRTLDLMIENENSQGSEQIGSPMLQDLTTIREKMRTIEQVITSFDLYDVTIENQRAMAGANTWQGGIKQQVDNSASGDEHD